MNSEDFQASVAELATRIRKTVADFFGTASFDPDAMALHGSQDIDQLAVEAHIYGAEIYPEI